MEIVKVVIPSHKRPDRVLATKAISNASICIPESQLEEYTKYNKGVEIITHPDSVIGIAQKRQWMYDKLKNLFMVDDDVINILRLYPEPAIKDKDCILTPDEAYSVVQRTAETAKQMGAFLFALFPTPVRMRYDSLHPFRVTGGVCCGWGLLEGSKLHFPKEPEGMMVEDGYVSLLNAYYHRYMFQDCRFAVQKVGMGKKTGGCSDFRTVELEKQGTLFLKQRFGDAVSFKNPNAKFQRKMHHQWERTINIPF